MEEVQTGDHSQEGRNKCHWAVKSWHQSQEKRRMWGRWCFRIWFFLLVRLLFKLEMFSGVELRSLARMSVHTKVIWWSKLKPRFVLFMSSRNGRKGSFDGLTKFCSEPFKLFVLKKTVMDAFPLFFTQKKKKRKMWQPNKHPKNFLWLKSKILKLWSML